jgi:hypothetical protein
MGAERGKRGSAPWRTSLVASALRGRPRLFSAAAAACRTRSACCSSAPEYQERKKWP